MVGNARSLGQENADDADSAGEAYGAHEIIQSEIGYFAAVRLVTLIADAFTTSVGALSTGLRQYLLHRGSFRVVDGDATDFLRQGKPVGMAIDHHDLAGALDHRRQRGHQTNRAGPINHNGLAGLETCEARAVPTGGKNIG